MNASVKTPAPLSVDEATHKIRIIIPSWREHCSSEELLAKLIDANNTLNDLHGSPLSDADVAKILRETPADYGQAASQAAEDKRSLHGRAKTLVGKGMSYAEARAALVQAGGHKDCDIEAALEQALRKKKGFPLTEVGDAEYFAAVYGDRVRYDHRRGRWLLHDDESGIWLPDQVEMLRGMAIDLMRLRQRVASSHLVTSDVKERMFKWAVAGESTKRLSNVLREVRAMPPIADAGDDWDTDPYLLGCANGVVDLRTGELRKGRPEERVTMRVSVPYDPAARCPLWLETLEAVFGGDRELFDFVHLALGYSLTGDCREECLFLMYGSGGNGKGTLINTVARVLGEYADDVPFATLERKDRADIPADVAKLVGKRLVTASESGGQCELNVERIKALTGRDPITARFMRENWFTFEPVAKFWLSSNEKPTVRDDSDGFWRRVHLIPFTQSFVGRADTTLKDRLKAEHAGILGWLVEGAVAWQREGLTPPEVVRVATGEYRKENDWSVTRFIDECCMEGPYMTQASVLYAAYESWCEGRPVNQTMFGTEMGKRFDKGKSNGNRVYRGIGVCN